MTASWIPRLAAAVALLTAGCGNPSGPGPEPEPTWREAQALAVEEAVYRFQFVDYLSEPQRSPITYCLARNTDTELLPWTDPPDALIRQFAGHQPAVKKLSSCAMGTGLPLSVIDAETGGPAVVFRLAPPRWESDTDVIVDGGHHASGLGGSGKTYRVRHEAGRWVVVDVRWRWIS